jgi:hypothetical protein
MGQLKTSSQVSTPIFNVSLPTRAQVIRDIILAVGVFLGTAFTVWTQNGQQVTKAAGLSAFAAGAAAVLAELRSFATTL